MPSQKTKGARGDRPEFKVDEKEAISTPLGQMVNLRGAESRESRGRKSQTDMDLLTTRD